MADWKFIKQRIKHETKEYFNQKNIDTDFLVDLLKDLIELPIDYKFEIEGLESRITSALECFFNRNSSDNNKLAYFGDLKNYDALLKKIIYVSNPSRLQKIFDKDEKTMGINLINELSLNPSRLYLGEETLQEYTTQDYEYYLIRTYILRNLESHAMKDWIYIEIATNIHDVLIFYLEVINRCKSRIEQNLILLKTDFSKYINSEIDKFEKLAKRFVATNTEEDFSVFDSYAIECFDDSDEEQLPNARSGTVDYIRKNILNENRMIIWGDAGFGKTTTLRYLTYVDAQDYKSGKSKKIPIYIPLGSLIDENVLLEEYIFKNLKINLDEGKQLLKKGLINIFIDGVNEIPIQIVQKRINEIKSLIDNYKNSLIIISNRPDSKKIFGRIPVFRLKSLNENQIHEFFIKNINDDNTREIIEGELKVNPKLKKIIQTPLMATRLISIVKQNKKIPQNDSSIIKIFLESLFNRESEKDSSFEPKYAQYLLESLAVYSFEKNKTNSSVSEKDVLMCFSECIQKYNFNCDTIHTLKLLEKMGVLSYENGGYTFSHQSYQDYYRGASELFYHLPQNENNNIVEKSDDKILIKTDTVRIINEDNRLDFYKFATNKDNYKNYEQSIISHIQNLAFDERNNELKILADTNIYLAAKIFSICNFDNDTEKYIVEKLQENYLEAINTPQKLRCIKAAIELKRLNEFEKLITDIAEKKVSYVRLIRELDEKELIYLLEVLINNYKNEETLQEFILGVSRQILDSNFQFVWKEDDKEFLNNLISYCNNEDLNKIIQLFLSFDIPKKFIKIDLVDFAYKYDDAFLSLRFILKYGFELKCELLNIKLKEQNKFSRFFNKIYEFSKSYIGQLFRNNDFFRAYIFTMFSNGFQRKIAIDYGFYYSLKRVEDKFHYNSDEDLMNDFGIKNNDIELYKYKCNVDSFINIYQFDSKERFCKFILGRVFKSYSLEIATYVFAFIYENFSNKISDSEIKKLFDESLKNVVKKDDIEFQFKIQFDDKEFIAKCCKNKAINKTSSKEWFLQKIYPVQLKK